LLKGLVSPLNAEKFDSALPMFFAMCFRKHRDGMQSLPKHHLTRLVPPLSSTSL
jgi:hypothetical protein